MIILVVSGIRYVIVHGAVDPGRGNVRCCSKLYHSRAVFRLVNSFASTFSKKNEKHPLTLAQRINRTTIQRIATNAPSLQFLLSSTCIFLIDLIMASHNNNSNKDCSPPRTPTDAEMRAVFTMCRQNRWNSVLDCILSNPLIPTTSMVMDNHSTLVLCSLFESVSTVLNAFL